MLMLLLAAGVACSTTTVTETVGGGDGGGGAGELPSAVDETNDPVARLTKSDVALSLKTTEKHCFGSAGCNVTVEVRAGVAKAVSDALPRDGTWDVTYQIDGGEDPVIGTFSLYGNGKYDVNEEFVGTPSSNSSIRVKVLSVERS
jgi:hypothetical protein